MPVRVGVATPRKGSMRGGRFALGFLVAAMLAASYAELRPHAQGTESRAEEAPAEETPARVTEVDLQRYIAVYAAMQADHSLTIEQAVAGQGMTVEDFRSLERRVQKEPQLVTRVREALLERAKAHAAAALPSPAASPRAHEPR